MSVQFVAEFKKNCDAEIEQIISRLKKIRRILMAIKAAISRCNKLRFDSSS